jgi:hypothetical protein
MLRSSRLALLSIALTIAAVPIVTKEVDARLPERATAASPKLDVPTATPVAMSTVLALNSFQGPTMRFQVKGDSADGAVVWSPRTQKAIQKAAFRHAVDQTFASRDFSPGTFAGSMLDSLVDFAGPDNVIEAAKSYRPKPDQYRVLLRAIRDRTPTVDPGDRNRSS